MATAESTDTVIIGAGPAGLAIGAALRKKAVPFILIEKEDAVGSSWRNHYERLHLHTVKEHSHLPFLPFPEEAPRYVPRDQVVAYLEDYARRFVLQPRLSERVEEARFVKRRWSVRTDRGAYTCRRLVVASGYNHQPKTPDWPGEADFAGEVLHSSAYRNGEPFEGKRVLVVGFGNSAGEIAIDLVERGARSVTMSVRSPVYVLPRDAFGVFPSQLSGMTFSKLPRRLADRISRTLARIIVGDLSRYGLTTPEVGPVTQVEEHGKVPLLDIGTIDLIKRGAITVVGDVARFTPRGVKLEEGAELELDAVIFATGYRAALERFLPDAPRLVDDRGYPRWHGREAIIPGLYFIGFRNPLSGFLHDVHKEALRIADDIAARV